MGDEFQFTYDSRMGVIRVERYWPFCEHLVYKIYVNGEYLVSLKNKEGIWMIPHPLIKEIFSDDIQAIGEEIDKRAGY